MCVCALCMCNKQRRPLTKKIVNKNAFDSARKSKKCWESKRKAAPKKHKNSGRKKGEIKKPVGHFLNNLKINLFCALFAWPPVRRTRTTIVLSCGG